MGRIILKFSGLLLILLLAEWWVLFLPKLPIPHLVPNTSINVGGLLLILTITAILIVFDKKALQVNDKLSIGKLTLFGTIICFLAEVIFQLIRLPTLTADTGLERVYYFFLGVVGTTFYGTILSFFVAFQIKTKKTKLLFLFITLFLALCIIVIKIYNQLNIK